ncbi:MAG: ABC transporter substrate-binding protein [Defluviitaleaceae bacterium]|nr:ABC transporter substrate-binding protein [Defluviitaleaceae bacterium]
MKKILALIIVLMMMIVVFAACRNDSNEGQEDDIQMLRAVFVGSASPAQDAVLEAVNAQLIADGYNFNIQIDYFDDYFAQLALAVTAGEVIDLAWAHRNYLAEHVRLRIFQPIGDAIAAHGPAINQHTPEFLRMGASVDGQQYGMPRVAPMSYNRSVLNIRGDLREAHGIPPITTVDHLEQFLQAVHEHEDGVYGAIGWLPETLYPAYVDAHFLLNWLLFAYPEDGTVQSLWHYDGMNDLMARIWTWAERGWIPSTEVRERLGGGDAGFDHGFVAVVNANPMRAAERIDIFTNNVPDGRIESVVLQPARPMNFFSGDNMLAVPSTSNNVNEAVAFVNWLKSSQANMDLMSFGIEGVNYTLVNDGVDTSIGTGDNHFSINRWMWDDTRIARFSANLPQADVNQLRTWDDGIALSPFLEFTFNEAPVSNQLGAVWGVVWDNISQWTTGQAEFAVGRDSFLAALDAAGIGAVIEEAQRQLDEFMAGR